MKIFNKILIISAGLFFILFNACTEDYPEREESYMPASDVMKVYFPGTAQSKFEVEPTDNSIEITVARVNTSNAASVGLTVNDYKNVFTVPASVDFAAGEAEKTITIEFEGLEVFAEYKAELILDEQFTNPYVEMEDNGTSNFVISVIQSDWADYASGTYNSEFFESEWPQVLQYSEILGRYRFPNLWADGYNWEFEWDGGKAITPIGTVNSSGYYVVQTGYMHATYGMVSTATDADPEYTFYDEDSDAFKFDRQWTVAAGSFGWLAEYFFISERF